MASNQQRQNQNHHQQQQSANSNIPASNYLNPTQDQVPAQRRRKSTLTANGFFIDYSCTRRRSSAAAWQARQAQAEQQYGQQFLRTYVSPVRWPRSSVGLGAPAATITGAAADHQRKSFSAVSPVSLNVADSNANKQQQQASKTCGGNSPISSPSRHLSFSTALSATPVAGSRLSRASYCPPPKGASHNCHSLRLHSICAPGPSTSSAVLDGSRKTSIFDPAGHSLLAPTLMAQRRRSTMITGAGGGASASAMAAAVAGGLVAEQQAQSSAAMISIAAKSAVNKSSNKLRSELAQHVPVIGCSPTSIKASLAALDETRKYEKLLRRLKRHQKQREKRKRKEREKRRKRLAKQMKYNLKLANSLQYLGNKELEDVDYDDVDGDNDDDVVDDGDGGTEIDDPDRLSMNGRRRQQHRQRQRQRQPSVAINLRRKSIRAIKDAAKLIKHPQRSYKKRASRTEGLSISSISIANFDNSSSSSSSQSQSQSQSQSPSSPSSLSPSRSISKSSHYSTSEVGPSDDNKSNDSESDFSRIMGKSSDDEYRYELNNDELFEDDNTMVNLSRTARSASVAAAEAVAASSSPASGHNKQQQASHGARKSIVSKAMKKLAKTISNSSSVSDRIKGAELANDKNNKPVNSKIDELASEQQQQSPITISSNNNNQAANFAKTPPFNQRRSSQAATGTGLNYWYYYYYLRENSADAIDDLPISACTSLLSDSERRTKLHINYSLARIRILNSSKNQSLAKCLYRNRERKRRLSMRYGSTRAGGGACDENLDRDSIDLYDQRQQQQHQCQQQPQNEGDPNLVESTKLPFDFSQSTDISLALSSTTASSSSGSVGSFHGDDNGDCFLNYTQRNGQQQQQPADAQLLTSSSSSTSAAADKGMARSSSNFTPLSLPNRRKQHGKNGGLVARDLQRRSSQRDISASRSGSTLEVRRETGQSASTHSVNRTTSWIVVTSKRQTSKDRGHEMTVAASTRETRGVSPIATISSQVSRGCSADDEATSVDVDSNRLVATFDAPTSLSSAGSREFALMASSESTGRKESSGCQQSWLLEPSIMLESQSQNYSENGCRVDNRTPRHSRKHNRCHQQLHKPQFNSGSAIKTTYSGGNTTTSGSTSSLSGHFDQATCTTSSTTATTCQTSTNKQILASQRSLNQLSSQPASAVTLLNLPEASSAGIATALASASQQNQPMTTKTTGSGSTSGGSKRSASFASSVLDNEKDEMDDFERFKGSYRGFKGSLASAMNPTPSPAAAATTTTGANKFPSSSASQKSRSQKSDDFGDIKRRFSKYSKFRFSLKSNRNSGNSKQLQGAGELLDEKRLGSPSSGATNSGTYNSSMISEQARKESKGRATRIRQSSMSWDTLAGSGAIGSSPMASFWNQDETGKRPQQQRLHQDEQQQINDCSGSTNELRPRVRARAGTINYRPNRILSSTPLALSDMNCSRLDYVGSANRLLDGVVSGHQRSQAGQEKVDQKQKQKQGLRLELESEQNSSNVDSNSNVVVICEQPKSQRVQQHRLSASSYQQHYQQRQTPSRAGSDKYLNATTSRNYYEEQDWKSDKLQFHFQPQLERQQQQHINHRETREPDRWLVCACCSTPSKTDYLVGGQLAKQEQKVKVDHYCDHQQHLRRELEISRQGSQRLQRASLSCCSSEETSERLRLNPKQEEEQQQQQQQLQQQLREQFGEPIQCQQTLDWDRCRARSHMSIVNLGISRAGVAEATANQAISGHPQELASSEIGFSASSSALPVGQMAQAAASNRSSREQDWKESAISLKVPSQQQQQFAEQTQCPICTHSIDGPNHSHSHSQNNSNNNNGNHQHIESETLGMKTMLNEAGSYFSGTVEAPAFQSSQTTAQVSMMADNERGEICVRAHSRGAGSESTQFAEVTSSLNNSVTLIPSSPVRSTFAQQDQRLVGHQVSELQKQQMQKQQQLESESKRRLQSVCQISQQRQEQDSGYSPENKTAEHGASGQLHAPATSASSSMSLVYVGQNSSQNKQAGGNFKYKAAATSSSSSATAAAEKKLSCSSNQQEAAALNKGSQVTISRQHNTQCVKTVAQQKHHRQQHRLEQQCIMRMLKKNSFTCMLVGSRQSGKRSIVKCFVKLLNEFRLAVKEYRREKMLTRLMDCSERLQELQEQQEEQQQHQLDRRTSTASQMFTRSRINSWLAGSGSGSGSAGAPNNKQRLNSVAATPIHHYQQQQRNKQMGLQSTPDKHNKQQHRRHTAIEQVTSSYINTTNPTTLPPTEQRSSSTCVNSSNQPPTSASANPGEVSSPSSPLKQQQQQLSLAESQKSTTGRQFLQVESTQATTTSSNRFNALNKSDFDISYDNNQDKINNNNNNNRSSGNSINANGNINNSHSFSTQLQVPQLVASTPNTRQSISFLTRDRSDLMNSSSSLRRSTQLLSPTSNSAVDLGQNARSSAHNNRPNNSKNNYPRQTRSRNQSVQIIGGGRRRPMLSLKELNKRRIRIRFRTRRQLNERYLTYNLAGVAKSDKTLEAEFSSKKESTIAKNNNETAASRVSDGLPDSFMVVYSINDRKSFEYAKTLVEKIRSIKCNQLPLPVVLVANKIDLERAKVVGSGEGKSLARKYSCKYMEISCTIGFNLDNLLVGVRTQLILKHHTTLNSILKNGAKALRAAERGDEKGTPTNVVTSSMTKRSQVSNVNNNNDNNKLPAVSKGKEPENILIRFYKRYLTDNQEQDYDCDNFSKL